MKKIILTSILLIAALMTTKAQSAKVMIHNYSDFNVVVTLHGYSPSMCVGPICGTGNYSTVPIFVGLMTNWGAFTPCAIASSGLISTVCSPLCPAPPADFQWTYAEITMFTYSLCGTFNINCGDNVIGCYPSVSTAVPCSTYIHYSSWVPVAGSALSDVTIDIF